jgi:hypothetical protein
MAYIRGLGRFWQNAHAQYAVRFASSHQHGVQCREARVLDGALPQEHQ